MTWRVASMMAVVLFAMVALPSCSESMEGADAGDALKTALATESESELSKSVRQLLWLTVNGTAEQRTASLGSIETIVRALEKRPLAAEANENGEPGLSASILHTSVYKPLAKKIKARRFDIELQRLYRTIRPPSDRVKLEEQWRAAAHESRVAVFSNILAVWKVHDGVINDVALTQYSTLVSVGHDGSVFVSSLTGKDAPRTLVTHSDMVVGLGIATDSPLGVSGSIDGTIKLWDTKTEKLVNLWFSTTGSLHAIAISADGTLVVSGGQGGSIQIWDTASGKLLRSITASAISVDALALSFDGEFAITAGDDAILRAWDIPTGEELWNTEWEGGAPCSIAISPDRSLVAVGDWATSVRLFDAKNGTQLNILKLGWGAVQDVCFSRDGQYIVTGGDTNSSSVIDVQNWVEVADLSKLTGNVDAVDVDVDKGIAVVGETNGWITIWDLGAAMDEAGPP